MNFIPVLPFLLGSIVVDALPQQRGACVVTCNPMSGFYEDLHLQDCPKGYECRSNGCGSQCYEINKDTRRGSCLLLCGDAINRSCLKGYQCGTNGCGSECIMEPNYKQPTHCPEFLCDLHCPTGFHRDENGCDHCQCDYSILTGRRK